MCLTPFHSLLEWWDVHPGIVGLGLSLERRVQSKLSFAGNWSWWQGVAFAHIQMLCVSILSCGRKEGSSLVPSALPL